MDETLKTEENSPSIEKVDENKSSGRKRPPPEPLPSRTRSTRAVKAAKRSYSPPLPSSSSSSKRTTRPSNRVKVLPPPPQPPTPSSQPVSGKAVKAKETKAKVKQEDAAQIKPNKPTTFDGQLELIHRASDDNKFARTLVTSLNHHAEKVVDNVRAKRNKGKNKLSRTMILQEMKNSKRIDINTPESILTSISSLQSIINRKNFEKLPSYYQYHLTKLLPKCDQNVMPNQVITPSESSFNNEFFARALASFSYRLSEGRLTNETMAKLKREMEREKKNLDPLKVKYFEPFFKDPEEQSSKDTQFEQDLSFLQTMSNCFEVVKCFCNNETFAKPVNIIRKGAINTPNVHFCDTVSSDDGKTMPIKAQKLKKDVKLSKKTNDASASHAKENVQSEFLIPMLPKEKKSDNITEEVLNLFDQTEFEQKILNPTKVILAPRLEPLQFSQTTITQENATKLSPQKPFIINTSNQPQMIVSSNGNIIPFPQILQTMNCTSYCDPKTTITVSAANENSRHLQIDLKPSQFKEQVKGKQKSPQKPKAPPRSRKTAAKHNPTDGNTYYAISYIKDALEGKMVLPKAIVSHVPFSKLSQDYSQNWGNYTQSMYYINSLVVKFIDQIQVHRNNFRKLHLACKVIFFSLEFLYTSCSDFLKSIQRLPNFPNVSLAITPVAWDPMAVGLPDEVNIILAELENVSNDCIVRLLNLSHPDHDSHEDAYLSNTNDNIIKHMVEHGLKLTSTLFDRIKKQFITITAFSYIDHVEYLRAAHSYRSFCTTAMEVINGGLGNAAGGREADHQAPGPSQLMVPFVTTAPVGVTYAQ